MVSTMGGAWAGILGAVTEFVLNTKNQMYNTNSGRSPALSIALAASFPLQVINQVVNDGRCICASVHRLGCCFTPWILWGSGGRDGMEVSPDSHQVTPDGRVILA